MGVWVGPMQLIFANIPEFEEKKAELPDAAFLSYKPDIEGFKKYWQEFGSFKNILLIGNGGSVTGLMGIYGCFGAQSGKHVEFLSTVDPEYIANIKMRLPKHNTLVIAISKSGQTVSQIEALMHFLDYTLLFITAKDSTLAQIGGKAGATIAEHPNIGGRYTAFTEVSLIPAAICGIDISALYFGAKDFYAKYRQNNIAMKAAQILFALENRGIVDVFLPVYSHNLFYFSNLIVQLCHESFGKNGSGQTYFAHEAPESQHHTNQRFFGGRKNIAGFFLRAENFRQDAPTLMPAGMHGIPLRDGSLFDLNKIPLSFAMDAEFSGTWEDAKIHGIPVLALSLTILEPKEIGQFIAFWQTFAVYSSILRSVDPFDQPQVESSKLISWKTLRDGKNGHKNL